MKFTPELMAQAIGQLLARNDDDAQLRDGLTALYVDISCNDWEEFGVLGLNPINFMDVSNVPN